MGPTTRKHATGPVAMIASDTLGIPRWDQGIRVHGFQVFVKSYAPEGDLPYVLYCYVQINRDPTKPENWIFVPVNPKFQTDYGSPTGKVREWVRVREKAALVSIFIPFNSLRLKKGEGQLRFYFVLTTVKDGMETLLSEYNTPTLPMPVRVQSVAGTVVTTGRVYGAPPEGEGNWTAAGLMFIEDLLDHPMQAGHQ